MDSALASEASGTGSTPVRGSINRKQQVPVEPKGVWGKYRFSPRIRGNSERSERHRGRAPLGSDEAARLGTTGSTPVRGKLREKLKWSENTQI